MPVSWDFQNRYIRDLDPTKTLERIDIFSWLRISEIQAKEVDIILSVIRYEVLAEYRQWINHAWSSHRLIHRQCKWFCEFTCNLDVTKKITCLHWGRSHIGNSFILILAFIVGLVESDSALHGTSVHIVTKHIHL